MSRLLKSIFSLLVFSVFFVFSVIFFLSSSAVSAQGIPGIGTPLTVTMVPTNPKAFDTVTLSLQSFSVNIDQAVITWYSDGKSIAKGTGLKVMTVRAGALGSSKTINVVASTKEAGDISGTVVIRPADLSLVWQTAAYVPAFYKGKSLLPYGAQYKVVALPEMLDKSGKKIDPRTLVYSWKKNDALQQEASGYGRDSFISTQESFVRQGDEIAVDVTSSTDGFTVSGKVTIIPVPSEIHFYENSPLYGIVSEKELSRSTSLANQEISIDAEPYFFTANTKQSSLLSYSWTLNGSNVSDFQDKSSIILRRADKSAGSAEIGLTMTNSARLLQGAKQSLILRYE